MANIHQKHKKNYSQVWSPLMTSGVETAWVYSYNPGAHMGLPGPQSFPMLAEAGWLTKTNQQVHGSWRCPQCPVVKANNHFLHSTHTPV